MNTTKLIEMVIANTPIGLEILDRERGDHRTLVVTSVKVVDGLATLMTSEGTLTAPVRRLGVITQQRARPTITVDRYAVRRMITDG